MVVRTPKEGKISTGCDMMQEVLYNYTPFYSGWTMGTQLGMTARKRIKKSQRSPSQSESSYLPDGGVAVRCCDVLLWVRFESSSWKGISSLYGSMLWVLKCIRMSVGVLRYLGLKMEARSRHDIGNADLAINSKFPIGKNNRNSGQSRRCGLIAYRNNPRTTSLAHSTELKRIMRRSDLRITEWTEGCRVSRQSGPKCRFQYHRTFGRTPEQNVVLTWVRPLNETLYNSFGKFGMLTGISKGHW